MGGKGSVMSSMERAPEPTMEEILASIRRIISDDETSTEQPPQGASASQEDDDPLEAVEGEADDKIINDIARVLSGGAPAPVEEPAAEDDILDLTAELGGLEPVETLELELELVEELEADEIQPDEPALELAPEPEPDAPVEVELPPPPEPAPPVQMAPPPQPMSMEPPQRKLSAGEEAASALERAIAALRAGQVPTMPPPPPVYMSTPEPALQPFLQPAPAPGFIPTSQPAPQLESAPEPEPELELVLTEFVETTETFMMEVIPSDELTAEAEEIAAWMRTPEPEPEPDAPALRTNGSGPHGDLADISALPPGSTQALEDSIKDILRPMLQQWLDENMARVVSAALKDEIRNDPARFQRD